MRYKAMFAAGLIVGFVAGTRAGRERYDQMVQLARQAAGSPPVQKATAKGQDLAKTAAAKAPDMAKNTMPKIMDAAKSAGQQAAGHLPFTGKSGDGGGASFGGADGADPRVPHQADGSPASFNGMRAD